MRAWNTIIKPQARYYSKQYTEGKVIEEHSNIKVIEVKRISDDKIFFANIFKLSTVVSVVRLYDYEIRNLSSISYAVENNISSDIVMSKIITSIIIPRKIS